MTIKLSPIAVMLTRIQGQGQDQGLTHTVVKFYTVTHFIVQILHCSLLC